MAKAGRQADNQPTRMIRVPDDIADMLAWLAEFNPGKAIADIVDPILRPEVEQRFALIRDRVEQIKAAKAGPVLVPDLGGEGG